MIINKCQLVRAHAVRGGADAKRWISFLKRISLRLNATKIASMGDRKLIFRFTVPIAMQLVSLVWWKLMLDMPWHGSKHLIDSVLSDVEIKFYYLMPNQDNELFNLDCVMNALLDVAMTLIHLIRSWAWNQNARRIVAGMSVHIEHRRRIGGSNQIERFSLFLCVQLPFCRRSWLLPWRLVSHMARIHSHQHTHWANLAKCKLYAGLRRALNSAISQFHSKCLYAYK